MMAFPPAVESLRVQGTEPRPVFAGFHDLLQSKSAGSLSNEATGLLSKYAKSTPFCRFERTKSLVGGTQVTGQLGEFGHIMEARVRVESPEIRLLWKSCILTEEQLGVAEEGAASVAVG